MLERLVTQEYIKKTRKDFLKMKHSGLLPIKKKCKYCRSTEKLTYDHKKPIIRGGTNDRKNIQVLCVECNQMKSNLSESEMNRIIMWYRRMIITGDKPRKKFLHYSKNYCKRMGIKNAFPLI